MSKRRPSVAPEVLKPPPISLKPPPVRTPKQPPRGELPNPRRPRLVLDVNGLFLGNLFATFPDLPWPPRPRSRVPLVTLARRLRR